MRDTIDFIESEAKDFYSRHLSRSIRNVDNTYLQLENKFSAFVPEDRIKYLEIIKNKVDNDLKEHLKDCESPETCGKNKSYRKILYYIARDLKEIQSSFELPLINPVSSLNSQKEKVDLEIDKVLAKLNELGLGQEILFDEIQELKNFSNLDKKSFRQIVFGKMGDIVFSEAGSQIAEVLKENGYGLKDIFKDLTGTTFKALGL